MAREPEIVTRYREAAERGDAMAQFNLGDSYRLGYRVPRDLVEAVRWLTKAASQGHREAIKKLRQMQAEGIDITPPPEMDAPRRQQSLDDLLDSLAPGAANEGDGGVDVLLPDPEPETDPLYVAEDEVDLAALRAAANADNTAPERGPNRARSVAGGTAARSATVRTPNCCSRAAVAGPTPTSRSTGKGWRNSTIC